MEVADVSLFKKEELTQKEANFLKKQIQARVIKPHCINCGKEVYWDGSSGGWWFHTKAPVGRNGLPCLDRETSAEPSMTRKEWFGE